MLKATVTRRIAPVIAAVAVAVAASLSAQQTRDTRQAAAPFGRISGTVVNAESGRPVRFARVAIQGPAGAADEVTGDTGAFVFDRLIPGTYQLVVTKSGYLDTAWGQARPGTGTPGKPIRLGDREQLDNLTVPISQGGSISGVVRDDRGEPAYQANVRVSRWVMRNGIRTLAAVASTVTDERGRYRLSLLPPRDYIVSATPNEDAVPGSRRQPATQGFAPVFYPGAVSARAASAVPLTLGEERTDIDVQLSLVPLGRVIGTVVDASGRPMTNFPVSLSERDAEDDEQGVQTDGAGRFVFERIVPGAYVVAAGKSSPNRIMVELTRTGPDGIARVVERKIQGASEPPAGQPDASWMVSSAGPIGSASDEVTVAGDATSSVMLTLEPPRTVAGRIMTEGASKPPLLKGTVVELTTRSTEGEQYEAKVADDGTFTIANVPSGRYIVSFAGEAPPWTLASALAGGQDVLDSFLEVPRGRDVRDLVLMLRDRHSELTGTVTDAMGKPATDRMAIVFPSDDRLWIAGDRRIKAMALASDGSFAFVELRPGAYVLAITDSVEPDEWFNPDFLRKVLPAAVPLTIAEGEKRVQDLRIR